MATPVTYEDIVDGLQRLGAIPTSSLMVHASLSAFGHVVDGAPTVIAALRAAAGEAGAAIIPSFRDAIRSQDYAMRECQAACPQKLCSSRERGFTGILGETVREQRDALRSCHPTHSWVGIGSNARFLLEGHHQSLTPCGRDSPFLRLLQCDGLVLLLGVGINSLTNIHAVEDARNVPYLSAIDLPRRHATYTTSGRRVQYRYPQLLYRALRQCELIRTTKIGSAACHALRARDLGAFLWLITEDDPWCLVLRPRGDRYDPDEDATAKTERMSQVWQDRPDPSAWRLLLDKAGKQSVPVPFTPSEHPKTNCPAYRGIIRNHHRCAANDIPPWERFEDFSSEEPGVATCETCNWPTAISSSPSDQVTVSGEGIAQ